MKEEEVREKIEPFYEEYRKLLRKYNDTAQLIQVSFFILFFDLIN